MNPKASAILEKACEDRRRSHFDKALSRLEEAFGKFPKELALYTEAIDVGMEAGESLKTIQILRKSQRELPEDAFELWTFTVEKVGVYNDPIVGRFMLEQAIKTGDVTASYSILQSLSDHAASEMLEHIRKKKQTMSLAMGTGHAARDDVVSFTLAEALLHLRLGLLAEAVEGFVRTLDENPGFFKPLEPFLTDLERQHGDKGEASFALGCCHIAGGRPSQGIESLARAARRTPSIAARAIAKIETLGDLPGLSIDVREATLADLYLKQNETRRSCEILSAMLERNPGTAGQVVDILKPAVENVGDDLETHFVFVEAAVAAGRRETALSQLRKIYGRREHRAPLVGWLETKSRSESFAAEVQFFFAETALSEGLYGKAIDIFKEMLSRGKDEQAPIKELLSRHQSNPLVQRFYTERFGASSARQKETTCEFERYDDSRLAPPKAQGLALDDAENTSPCRQDPPGSNLERVASPSFETAEPVSLEDPGVPDTGIDNRDFSLAMHAPDDPPAGGDSLREESCPTSFRADPPPPAQEIEDSDLFDYLKRDFSAAEPASEGGLETDAGKIGCETPQADQPGEVCDRTAREQEQGVAAEITEEPCGAAELTEEPCDEAELPEDFDSLYRAFLGGTLDRGRTLEVIEWAFDEDRMEEMKKLLAFEPANLGEEIARKHQLARYYLATDRPMSALVALKTVQLAALGKEERKTFMLRIAESYRRLHNFEAAHGVYLRVLSEHPGDPEAEASAKANYAMYIEAAAGAAPILEKLTNL